MSKNPTLASLWILNLLKEIPELIQFLKDEKQNIDQK